MGDVTITKKQREEYERLGKSQLDKNVISGFNLEDFNKKDDKGLYYAHSSPKHISIIKQNIGGKTYPRESIYRWDKDWTLGENTILINKDRYAKEKSQYIMTKNVNKADKFIRTRALADNPLIPKPISKSWEVPDVRLYNILKPKPHYRKAYLVTKGIDRNSRFATIITRKDKLNRFRRAIKGEKVQTIQTQDYKPKKHSLFGFIESVYSHWKNK